MRRAPFVLLAVVVAAAGCGGGAKTYSLAKTRACLKAKGVRVGGAPRSDFVASTAPGGAFLATLPANFVTVVFAEDGDNADQIEKAYHQFAFPNVKQGLGDVLKRDGNVIRLWHEHPDPKAEATIRDCLE